MHIVEAAELERLAQKLDSPAALAARGANGDAEKLRAELEAAGLKIAEEKRRGNAREYSRVTVRDADDGVLMSGMSADADEALGLAILRFLQDEEAAGGQAAQ